MALKYVYEQDYLTPGWADDGGGVLTLSGWYDRDLTDDPVVPLYVLQPEFFVSEADVFFQMPPLTTEVHPILFIEDDFFYIPMSVRALTQPIQMLRNEVRRVR